MSWPQVVVLAIVQGLTEFLPVSSSGHLALVSRLFFAGDAGASFTAVTQIGTEVAVLVYFAKDIARIATAWLSGVASALAKTPLPAERKTDYRMGWYVIVGSIPIVIVGVLFQHFIRGEVRNLWVIASAMVGFSLVIAAAEYVGRQQRHAEQLTVKDGFLVGAAQCLALIPGVSRSGATISAGLFLGMDRALAARFGFLLGIPAVFASGLHELPNAFHPVTEGMSATGLQLLVSVVITFVVGYAAISWLLRFVSSHTMYWFVGYRVIAGTTILILLATGVLAASS
ncbi:undecaprenyl-diphosphatase [Mycolicibacter heraklionensis]|uniref:Undecaprenyl-diphosphatase n=1 Tax=Mycolicibacter heraklionensis TaxID=512402 RepID=A0AA91IW25_9MYCO|nr:undecaprenyl-diphosphate phosphatase [Mycolicibacter heraklionensis]OBK80977.1 undecaprenyl-diphosphatase [Mycolicibacter heraklionensis]